MTTIGFVGLGIMGGPMAANLVKAGYDVVGTNLTRPKIDWLAEQGGRGADSIAETVKDADVIITMLPDSPDVEVAALGDDGILAHAGEGTLYIDCSSIRPDTSRAVAETAASKGVRTLDAPVSGGEPKAIDGTLSLMVGGEPEAFEAGREFLETVGSTIVHVGPAGSGQTVKIANQLIVAGNIGLLAEALLYLEAHGVDTEAGMRALGGGLAGSAVLDAKAEKMRSREFKPGFRIELHDKDLGNLEVSARQAGLALPIGALVTQVVAAAKAQGDGSLDHSGLFRQLAQLSGRD